MRVYVDAGDLDEHSAAIYAVVGSMLDLGYKKEKLDIEFFEGRYVAFLEFEKVNPPE